MAKSKPKDSSEARGRISLDVDPSTKADFETVRKDAKVSTLTELIKKAVAFFGIVTKHQAKGGDVILRHKDGKEDRVLFF